MVLNSETQDREAMLKLHELFESIAMKLKNRIHQSPTKFQLAGGQVFVMVMLQKQGVCKASEIAAKLGITSGAVTGLTDKLVCMGLLHRIRSEEDRRVVQFSLTENGIEILKQIRQERSDLLLRLFEHLETEDLNKMLEVFTKLNAILE